MAKQVTEKTLDEEFWTYEVTITYPFHPGKIVSIYSIPMYMKADHTLNMEPDNLICTPDNEEIAKRICLDHNTSVLNYHRNKGNNAVEIVFNKLLCAFGKHNWKYSGKPYTLQWKRSCSRCPKEQTASYDMAYGETIWS